MGLLIKPEIMRFLVAVANLPCH